MGYFDNPDQCMCEQGDNNILYKSHTKAAIVLGNWLSVLNSNFSFQIIKELVVSKWWKEGQDEGGGRGQQEGVFLCTIRHPPVASWCHHPHICKSALSFCLSVILSFWQCLIVGECMGSVAFFFFLFCLFGSEGLSLRVSYCGRVRGRRCLLSETVHLAHCHTATHAPTRPPSTLIGPHIDQSRISCPDGHRDNGDPETCMEWNGLRGGGEGGVGGVGLGGEQQLQGGGNLPSSKYGSPTDGSQNWEVRTRRDVWETFAKRKLEDLVNLVAKIKEPWDRRW